MPDERQRRESSDPAEQARQDIERADRHADRRLKELREEVRKEIDRTGEAVRDRDEVGERPVPPKSGP